MANRRPTGKNRQTFGRQEGRNGKQDNWLCQVFQSPQGRWSSKRFFGGLGFMVVLGVLIYCTYTHTEAPEITEIVCIVSASLMGIGVIEPYFRSKPKVVRHQYPDQDEEEREPYEGTH